MNSPINALSEKLRTLAVTETTRKLGPLIELRHAIDAYEEALGYETERQLVERFDDVGIELGERIAPTLAQENVGVALHAALAWFSREEPVGGGTSHQPELFGVAQNEAPPELPGAGEGDDSPAVVENPAMGSQALSPSELEAYFDQLRRTPAESVADPRQARATERQTLGWERSSKSAAFRSPGPRSLDPMEHDRAAPVSGRPRGVQRELLG